MLNDIFIFPTESVLVAIKTLVSESKKSFLFLLNLLNRPKKGFLSLERGDLAQGFLRVTVPLGVPGRARFV